ncbi:MAG: alpha/beta fold hydrolase [Rhodospirillales bacterium]|nr:alpha/beta fold hydrolase [Rhodospirillales bacterium]MBN8897242.1 alpha/beta fold hydrolase [Rhodospirillales bacterium]
MATIVLLHGAYQGGWIWQRVTPHLRAAGHTVFAPTLDGCAERRHALRPGIDTESHAAEITELLFFEDLRDVVLVGTSCGGMVLCRVAEQVPDRVGRLVLADALALFDGETLADHVQRPTAVTTALATGPSPEDAAGRMFASLDPATKDWALARVTPHPVAAMTAPVKLDRFWDIDWRASVIWCRQSPNPPRAHQERAATRLRATWHELDTGHYPMLTEPAALARLIMLG